MALFNLWEQTEIQKTKPENMFNTETMLPISEIKSETIILKDWWLRSILKIEWINLDLKNWEDIQIIIEQYKRFLNWLLFFFEYSINEIPTLDHFVHYLPKKFL